MPAFLLRKTVINSSAQRYNLLEIRLLLAFLWLKLFLQISPVFGNNCSFNFTHAIQSTLKFLIFFVYPVYCVLAICSFSLFGFQ